MESWKCVVSATLMLVGVCGVRGIISSQFVSLVFSTVFGIVLYFVLLFILREKMVVQYYGLFKQKIVQRS